MQTLRRELRIRFDAMMKEGKTAEQLADAALEIVFVVKPKDANVELFRGDFHEYPEHLWNIAECIRDTWKLPLPAKPRRGEKKSQYGFWIQSMDDLKIACGEKGTEVLEILYKEYVDYSKTHNGTWPHTVSGPQSLVNVARGKAAQLRSAPVEQKARAL